MEFAPCGRKQNQASGMYFLLSRTQSASAIISNAPPRAALRIYYFLFFIYYLHQRSFSLLAATFSGSVVPIDLHIVIGQIAAPGLGGVVSVAKVDQNINLVLLQHHSGLVLAVGVVGGVLADKDLARLALEAHAGLADVKIAGRVADGAEHAAFAIKSWSRRMKA